MKITFGRVLFLAGIGVLAAFLLCSRDSFIAHIKRQPVSSLPTAKPVFDSDAKPPQTNQFTHPNPLNIRRTADFSKEEMAMLAKKFNEQLEPAIKKWSKAYEGRVPFNPDDLTFDKFHNRLGKNTSFYLYTFVFNDTTLTIEEANGKIKVNYLMVREAAIKMNELPGDGFVPNITVPVTKVDVIRMVESDSGVEFKPNEVIIRPTAQSTALNGGAFVDLLPTGKDPDNALNYKISMVFDSSGKLVNYERDPFF